jgi:hypothetical protein
MPYGSQSPLTIRLTQLFSDPAGLDSTLIANVGSLVGRAQARAIVRNNWERDHLAQWPQDQQEMVRRLLVHCIEENRPIIFDWEESATFCTTIVDFGDGDAGAPPPAVAVTFRSPRY